jgi:hypothetical protein
MKGGNSIASGSIFSGEPWPFPRRVPGPRETTYPCSGRLCPPTALAPVAAGYNTSRSTGFPTLNTVPSWVNPQGLGACSPMLPCPNPWWHDYSLRDDGGEAAPALTAAAVGSIVALAVAALMAPIGLGAIAGAALSPKSKRKRGALYGALGGFAGGMATGAVLPGTGALGALVGGGLVGKYIVPELD